MAHSFTVAVDLVGVDDDLLAVLVERLRLFVDVLEVAVDFGPLLDLVFLLLILQFWSWVLVPLAVVPAVLILESRLLSGCSLCLAQDSTKSSIAPARYWLVLMRCGLASGAVLGLSLVLVHE
jgi:hypothetical protein